MYRQNTAQMALDSLPVGAADTRSVAFFTFITVLILRPLLAILLIRYTSLGLMGHGLRWCLTSLSGRP